MASTITQFDAFLKNYFNPQMVEDLTKAGKPFFGRIAKNEAVVGDDWMVPILIGNPQGLAAKDRATAQTSASNIQGQKWAITMSEYAGSVYIGDKVIMASRNNAGAFLENKATEIEGLYEAFSDSLAKYLYRDGGGSLGQISAISGNAITLTDPAATFNFEINTQLAASTGTGVSSGDALRANTGACYVASIDRIGGILTVNDASKITSLSVGDYLFRLGDFVGNTSTLLMHGVQAYITTTTNPGTLWGVTRTTDVQRLSGCKIATSQVQALGIEDRIQLLGSQMAGHLRGMSPTGNYEIYINPEDYNGLIISLQSRGIRELNKDDTQFGYEYVEVFTGGKKMKVFGDPYCPKGIIFMLNMKNWVLGSYGQLIRTMNADGLTMLRGSTTDDYEYRLKGYMETSCNAPGFSGYVPAP